MEERRQSHRGRTHLGGRIVFNGRASTVDCLVRNLSPDGARITLGDVAVIPGDFEIDIHGRAETKRARVVWRNGTQAGIEFVRPSQGPFVSLDAARRIRKLEAEREALAKRVAELSV